MKKHTTIDDMNYNEDNGHIVDWQIQLFITCSSCDNQFPIEKSEWSEEGYHVTITPHICVWLDDDFDKNMDRIKGELE